MEMVSKNIVEGESLRGNEVDRVTDYENMTEIKIKSMINNLYINQKNWVFDFFEPYWWFG